MWDLLVRLSDQIINDIVFLLPRGFLTTLIQKVTIIFLGGMQGSKDGNEIHVMQKAAPELL